MLCRENMMRRDDDAVSRFGPFVMLILLAAAGCRKPIPRPAGAGGGTGGPSAAALSEAAERRVLQVIDSATNVFDLFEMKLKHQNRQEKSQRVLARTETRMRQLASAMTPRPDCVFSNDFELLSFDFRPVGADQYRLYYLVHFASNFSEQLRINADMEVAKSHEAAVKKPGWVGTWAGTWNPPQNGWRRGEHVVFATDVKAPPAPYRIRVDFARRVHSGAALGLIGLPVDMGWFAPPSRPATATNAPPASAATTRAAAAPAAGGGK